MKPVRARQEQLEPDVGWRSSVASRCQLTVSAELRSAPASEVLIETAGILVFGMNRKGADAGNIGSVQGTLHGVPGQRLADALAVPASIHPQARQQHDRYRVPGKTLGQPTRRFFLGHLAHGNRKKPDDGIIDNTNVRLRCACLLVLPGIAHEIPIQLLVPAIEALDRVVTS